MNRVITCELAGRRDIILLNGNPDIDDMVSSRRLCEITGMRPVRIGRALACAVVQVRGFPTKAVLDTAGMLAWRQDTVRLVLEAADMIRAHTVLQWSDALCRSISARDGRRRVFRGWHRPAWFDAARRSGCPAAVVGVIDPVGRRREAAAGQLAVRSDGSLEVEPSPAIEVDLVELGAIDKAKGTFEAEALVHLGSGLQCDGEQQPDCGRVLNAVGAPEWIQAHGRGSGAYALRGAFRFDPDPVAYPFDSQLPAVCPAADVGHARAVMRASPRAADIDCASPGWRIVSGHRAVTWSARPSIDASPSVMQWMEFGVSLARARRNVALRVGLPLELPVVIAGAALVAGAGHAGMVVGILGEPVPHGGRAVLRGAEAGAARTNPDR